MNRFYIEEKISEHIGETPEGFLVCYDVPISRTGEMVYKGEEISPYVTPDENGLVRIKRDEKEVFKPESIQSFEGKPLTIDHPDELVTPENWKDVAHGFITNVRKGVGDKIGMLVGDIVVTTKKAIELIKNGLRQISCGYDADYEEIEKGLGSQKNIIGNHVALVLKGRAGPRCTIMDKDSVETNKKISEKEDIDAMKFKDKLKKVYKSLIRDSSFSELDEEEKADKLAKVATDAVEESEETQSVEPKSSDTSITELKEIMSQILSVLEELVTSLSSSEEKEPVEEPSPSQDEDKTAEEERKEKEETLDEEKEEINEEEKPADKKTMDSMWFDTAYRADLIDPGISLSKPTSKKGFMAALNDVKRKALSRAFTNDSSITSQYIKNKKEIDKLDGRSLDIAFVAVSEAFKEKNNKLVKDSLVSTTKTITNQIEEIQKRNKDFWKKNK